MTEETMISRIAQAMRSSKAWPAVFGIGTAEELARVAIREALPWRKELDAIRCRFGCKNPVGIFHVPKGCICWGDPIQALCQQHLITAESEGPITCIVDWRVDEVALTGST